MHDNAQRAFTVRCNIACHISAHTVTVRVDALGRFTTCNDRLAHFDLFICTAATHPDSGGQFAGSDDIACHLYIGIVTGSNGNTIRQCAIIIIGRNHIAAYIDFTGPSGGDAGSIAVRSGHIAVYFDVGIFAADIDPDRIDTAGRNIAAYLDIGR